MIDEFHRKVEEAVALTPQARWSIAMIDIGGGGLDLFNLDKTSVVEAASLNKLAIARVLLHSGIRLDKEITLEEHDKRHDGAGILKYFPNGYHLTVEEVLRLSLSESDNTAAGIMARLADGPLAINEQLDQLGYRSTKLQPVNSNDSSPDARFTYGYTSADDVVHLMRKLLEHPAVAYALTHSNFTYGLFGHANGYGFADDAIPEPTELYIAPPPAAASRSKAKQANGLADPRVYRTIVKKPWPLLSGATKEGSYGGVRGEVARMGHVAIAVIGSNFPEDLPIGPTHPAHVVQAKIGWATLRFIS